MNRLLIGNVFALIASIVMVAIGLIKDKKKTLIFQTLDFGLMSISNIILSGVAGFISNIISIIRNIICIKFDFNTKLKIIFIVCQAIMIYIFNTEGLYAILPVIAVLIYTIFLDTKNPKIFKASICASQAFWAIYDISILNISAFIFDILTIITNLIALYQLFKEKEKVTNQWK